MDVRKLFVQADEGWTYHTQGQRRVTVGDGLRR